MFFKQFEILCTKNGTTPTAFVRDVLNLSTSKVTAWKNGSIPKIEILQNIANYFGVSVGYLFDGKEKNSISDLTDIEYRGLKAFRYLTHDDKIEFASRMEQRYEDYTPEQKENVS